MYVHFCIFKENIVYAWLLTKKSFWNKETLFTETLFTEHTEYLPTRLLTNGSCRVFASKWPENHPA